MSNSPSPTLPQRLALALFSSCIMAISAGFSAWLIAEFALKHFGMGLHPLPFITRYVITGFIAEFPLWFVGAGRLRTLRLPLRLGFSVLLGLLNALLSHGLVLFTTDLYNALVLQTVPLVSLSLWHSLAGSMQFGMIWLLLVGQITLPSGALFGALAGLLLPACGNYLERAPK